MSSINSLARRTAGAVVLFLTASLPFAADAASQQLTVEQIFDSSALRPQRLGYSGWLDARTFTFLDANAADGADLWAEDVRTGERRLLLAGSQLVPARGGEPIVMEEVQWSDDHSKLLIFTNTQRVWRRNTKGTYYVYDFEAQTLTPVSRREGWQMFAKFSPAGNRVGFVRDNDLFVTDLRSGRETQLTTSGSETIINGTFDWVYEEELGLRDGWRWSPEGRRIAFWQLDQSPIAAFYMISEQALYPELTPIPYPKAGTPNSLARIGVIELQTGAVTWMNTGEEQDVYLARMDWAASPDELVIQRLNRHQNRLDVLLADAASGASRLLFSDTDPAWVDVDDDLTWIKDGRQLIWSSERDGYNHLYLYDRDGSLARQITRGPWEVTAYYGYDAESDRIYFQATEEGATQRHIYAIGLGGGEPEQLSEEPGFHSADFGPRHDYLVETWSRFGVPPTTRLFRASGELVRVLVDNAAVRERLAGAAESAHEFFRFETSRGDTLNGWMLRPPGFDATRRYPVLMYVYGGPGSQTVIDAWGGNRYLWHRMLAERGYIVVSVDNRGTGGRGAAFKKATYQRLGVLEAEDQIDAARHLARLPFVDPGRIGIWGWSYGGYMTLLAMMQGGELFRAGISVAPVTDWSLYDTIYTERYMRTPQENASGYGAGSPLAHAKGLEGDLLIVHGSGDDNVHFQNTMRLLPLLQESGKQFDLMIYPDKTHSIAGDRTQVHLFTLMTDWLDENLLGAPARRAAQ